MQGFGASDVESVKPEDFIEAADTLIENGSDGNKRVANILRIMATAFKQQEAAAEQFKQMQANGKLKRI